MNYFLRHILIILGIVVVSAFALDFIYTSVYKSESQRNKIRYVLNGKPEQYDLIILGSSRANNHFVTDLFEKKGIKTYNYGMSGSRLQETALFLQLFFEKGFKTKKAIVEVDLNINSDGFSDGTRASFLPYLNSEKLVSSYYDTIPNAFELKNIPFYRYIKYEAKIGFREMFFSFYKRKTSFLANGGFYALSGVGKNMEYDLTSYKPKRNKSYELIKQICKKYHVELITVTTPMCSNTKNSEYFNQVIQLYPEIYNLENVINEDKYFSSCGHMNDEGARKYTNFIINKFFK